ncbi:serine/arginine-rich SC35-like splicing factor SCL30 isoform X2 [Daucus carota subsp. sativus]|uniref:serine/arginine-rich SC35-like splicing factor SCL30 isoform X2 n=1 Tax=Daucus carota subsp. sativus TaxID=79200 RepID=UPI0007EF9DBF|nr:PREDICTED: serine/arginine-rich SC35-like splicing factor SCL30 isoform X2 [Daucus carota subsp. sativus]
MVTSNTLVDEDAHIKDDHLKVSLQSRPILQRKRHRPDERNPMKSKLLPTESLMVLLLLQVYLQVVISKMQIHGLYIVSNVHFAATKDSLLQHFNKFGDVLKVIIVTDATTGQPKGSAYVEFTKSKEAEHALSLLDGTSFLSRILKVVKESAAPQEAAICYVTPSNF